MIRFKTLLACILIILSCLVSLLLLPILYANSDSPFERRQRPSVNFLDTFHDGHMVNLNCLDCHHRYEDGENVLEEADLYGGGDEIRCASCHYPGSGLDLMDAYHRLCIGCHDRESRGGTVNGPVLCGECHVRPTTTQTDDMNGESNGKR